jgi:DNA-binding NarL/FixJ family response regulator
MLYVDVHYTEGGASMDRAAPQLSPRQQEVAVLLLQGYRDCEIGAQLKMALPTVRTHVSRLMEKYGAATRAELGRKAGHLSDGVGGGRGA